MRHAPAVCALVMAAFSVGFAAPAAALDRLVDDSLVPCVGGGLPIHDTIAAAVAAAAPGETIGVCAGTYTEAVDVGTDGLVLQALGLVTVVSPGPPGFGSGVFADDVTIQGFDISGFNQFNDCGIVAFGPGGDIRSNRVHDNDFGICVAFAEGTRVRNNLVENNLADGILADGFDSLRVSAKPCGTTPASASWGSRAISAPSSPPTSTTTA